MNDAGELLTLDEVARITGRSREVVRRWARQGLLATHPAPDGTLRFPLAGLRSLARDDLDGEPLYRRLRAARLERGWSQAALADALGTSQRMVAFWEQGPQGKPIGRRYVEPVRRWVEVGQLPAANDRSPSRAADPWEPALTALGAFAQREGHADVPPGHVEDGIRLGRWVARQRRLALDGAVPSERAVRLGEIPGWTWAPDADGFSFAIDRLRAHREREGTARVCIDVHTPDGFPLGRWCAAQRRAYGQGRLDATRTALLDQIPGWVWTPRGRTPGR